MLLNGKQLYFVVMGLTRTHGIIPDGGAVEEPGSRTGQPRAENGACHKRASETWLYPLSAVGYAHRASGRGQAPSFGSRDPSRPLVPPKRGTGTCVASPLRCQSPFWLAVGSRIPAPEATNASLRTIGNSMFFCCVFGLSLDSRNLCARINNDIVY